MSKVIMSKDVEAEICKLLSLPDEKYKSIFVRLEFGQPVIVETELIATKKAEQ